MTVGVGLLTAIMSPSVINQQVVLDSSVEAASAKITYTDAQQVTYSLVNGMVVADALTLATGSSEGTVPL